MAGPELFLQQHTRYDKIKDTTLMKKVLLLLSVFALSFAAEAQIEIIDGAYKRENYKEKKAIPLSYIREADAIWGWNIIRVVDIKQKQNLPLTYPKARLIDVLLEGMRSGEFDDFLFSEEELIEDYRITSDKVLSELEKVDTFESIDPVTYEPVIEIVPRKFNPEDVVGYRIKEEWVFDKERSTLDVRIIAMAPITKLRSSDGIEVGEIPMFWVYYPAIRDMLATTEMFNWKNSSSKISFDDFFIMRLFSSYIYKQDNVYDQRIQDYKTGRAAVMESQRIKNVLIDFEQSLWEY